MVEIKYVPTICPYCGTGCGLNFVVKDDKIVGVEPYKRHPVNEGKVCPKGNFGYEFINRELGDLALMIRPTFNVLDREVDVNAIINDKNALGPKELLIDELKEYDSEDVNNLAIELYDLLSKNKTDESEDLVNQFFNEKYNIINDDSGDEITENKPEDDQVRFSGALQ